MNRRLPLILVAGLLGLCVIGVIVVGIDTGSGLGAVAYTVGDTKVSQRSVNSDLRALAENEVFSSNALQANPFATTSGAVSATGAANWLTVRVELDILRSAAEEKPTAAALDESRAALLKNLKSDAVTRRGFLHLPKSIQDTIVEISAFGLAAEGSQSLNSKFTQALRTTRVTVDPKYGFWNARSGQVCPPTGCATASSGSSSAGG